ncbi:MAG: GNAT family N-acetyltransferase [Bacteroidales bacterium]|nr:GNAT family N-acetyltransferase [Bacteroidales bacterium]
MIKLKQLKKHDCPLFYQWINDKDTIQYSLSLFQRINTKKEIKAWYLKLLRDNKNINLGIYLDKTNKLIGYAGLSNISNTNKSAEYFIFIGDKEYWGSGIGSQVTKQIIELGFSKYKLNRIMLTVSELNIGGIKAYKNAGFKTEGIMRQANFREGIFHDKLIMSILKSEWITK